MDYAIKNGVSLSTLRRYIKANKVQFKTENGRYLLLDSVPAESPVKAAQDTPVFRDSLNTRDSHDLQMRMKKLERELREAHEEIAELKMLVALYEEQTSSQRLDH